MVSPEDRELALENERLRRENRILKEERDILKKATQFFAFSEFFFHSYCVGWVEVRNPTVKDNCLVSLSLTVR
ncbi:hypothetical protein, partial [Limnoraphis robusta]|uniref:hypothetical protein n=1 Tax=Limnoraphis robusta TaxID=1118279 RepID=UPI001F446867